MRGLPGDSKKGIFNTKINPDEILILGAVVGVTTARYAV